MVARHPLDRREFLRWTLAAGGGAVLVPWGRVLGEEEEARPRAKVVVVSSPDVMPDETSLDPAALRKMLEAGITKLAGRSDVAEAWKAFVGPADRVVLNDAGTWLLNVPQLVVEVLRGLAMAKPKSLTFAYCVLDGRHPTFLESIRTGLKAAEVSPDVLDGGIYIFPGKFHEHPFTTIVSTPTLKSHTIAGVAGVVKHYATLSKTHVRSYHANAMETAGVVLRDEFAKHRHLVIVDALRWGKARQGPQHYRQSLVLGTDPVATDVVALRMFLENCETHGEIPPDRHRVLADTRYGAGISDPERIDVEKVVVRG